MPNVSRRRHIETSNTRKTYYIILLLVIKVIKASVKANVTTNFKIIYYFKLGARSENEGIHTKNDETSFGYKT